MIRNSDTHPIRLDFVTVPNKPSVKFGMTFCPGKVQQHSLTGSWSRNLRKDLERIKNTYKVKRLVSCIEPFEYQLLEVQEMANLCEEIGIDLLSIPIHDGGTPDKKSISRFHIALSDLLDSTPEKGFTAIFCKGGLGRTGVITSCLLMKSGVNSELALELVRNARPGTVENQSQEMFITNYQIVYSSNK